MSAIIFRYSGLSTSTDSSLLIKYSKNFLKYRDAPSFCSYPNSFYYKTHPIGFGIPAR